MTTPARYRPRVAASLRAGLAVLGWLLLLTSIGWAAEDPRELLDAGRADEAIRVLTPQANAGNATALNYLGRAYFAMEDWDNAVRNCERAVQIEPGNAMFQLWLGRSYGEKASISNPLLAFPLARKTVAAFRTARQLDRENMAIARDLAEYYAEAPLIVGGGNGKAIALAAELAPRHPLEAAWVRARAASTSGHNEEAARQYLEAIRLDHDSAVSYLDLARFQRGRKLWDDFQRTVERALQSAEIRPDDRYDAADLLLATNRNLEVAEQQMRAYIQSGHTEESSPVFRAHYLLGEIFLRLGDKGKAGEEYRAALALASSYRPAAEALRRLGQQP